MRKLILIETDGYTSSGRAEFSTRLGVAKGQLASLDRDELLALRSAVQRQLGRLDEAESPPVVIGGEG